MTINTRNRTSIFFIRHYFYLNFFPHQTLKYANLMVKVYFWAIVGDISRWQAPNCSSCVNKGSKPIEVRYKKVLLNIQFFKRVYAKKNFNDINAAVVVRCLAKQQKKFKIEKRFRISNWRFLSHKLSLQFMQIQTIQPPDNICNWLFFWQIHGLRTYDD